MSRAGWVVALLVGVLMGCGSPAPRAIWIGGDVQVSQPGPRRFAALAAIEGVGVVNLEGPIGAPRRPISATHLTNDAAVPDLLRRAGAGVLGLANNHRDDLGRAGLRGSIAAIESAGLQAADRGRPARVGDAGLIVAGQVQDVAQMQADLRERAHASILRVASLHVVAPPSYLPEARVRSAVGALLAAGADVVAVHGSHAIGPVERRGHAIIAWGLGNLAFDCACTREDEALILRVWRVGAAVEGAVVPIQAGLMGQPVVRHPDAAGIIALLQGLGSDVDATGRVRAARSAVVTHAGAQADAE